MPQPQQDPQNPGSSLSNIWGYLQNMMGQHQLQQAAAQGGPSSGGVPSGPAMPGVQQAIAPQISQNPIMQALGKMMLGKQYDPIHDQDPSYLKGVVDHQMAVEKARKEGKPLPGAQPMKHGQQDTSAPFMDMFHGLISKLTGK